MDLVSCLSYLNIRRCVIIVLIASTIIVWTFNYFQLQDNIMQSFEQPRHVDDRIRVINSELTRVKRKLEEKSMARSLTEYSRLSKKTPMKTVLAYTPYFFEKPWHWMNGTDRFNVWEGITCPYFRCKLTFDNNEFRRADAVLFHAKDLPGRIEMFRIAKQKPKSQKWVYFALESPMYNPDSKWLNNLFHYTLTYRRDSDFYSPYGYYYRVTNGVQNQDFKIREILRKKDHFIFWASSHCGIPREKFIRNLLKYIKIDVYGKCADSVGTKESGDCGLHDPNCDKLKERYKFQLGFENSNCKDYITEKYWGALNFGIVPIVLGGGNYSNIELAIPGSFINAMNFKTIKQLADYLVYLDRNQRAYSEYFEWRKTYKKVTYAPWTCQICAALNMNTKKTYIGRLNDFWSVSRQCHLTDTAIDKMVAQSENHRGFETATTATFKPRV